MTNSNSLVGQVSNTTDLFSQFLEDRANGLYDTSVDFAIHTDPTMPITPGVPTNPGIPTDPTMPTNPVIPTNPDIPIDPTMPITPGVPTNPGIPTDPTMPTDPGETISEALDFGSFDGSGTLTHTDSVGSNDLIDLYQFSITESNSFSFVLDGMSADADLAILDSSSEVLTASANADLSAEVLDVNLGAGTYFLGVVSYDSMDTSYDLSVYGGEYAMASSTNAIADPSLMPSEDFSC